MSKLEQTIANVFLEMADGLEHGTWGGRPKIAITGMGSEHGEENVMAAAKQAAAQGVEVYYIGTLEAAGVKTIAVENEDEGHKKMEQLVHSGEVDGAVTMHFPFPIGVSTVGRVITPAKGKEMFIASTTGTASADRVEGMVRSAVHGIITAKATGIARPTVGILNVDGARQAELVLKEMQQGGYEFDFAGSARSDGGAVMRGNDVLQASADVLVTDSLTGNVLVKMLSAYATGGSYEASGYGYGPGVGPDYENLILIISRASGAPLIANAICFAAQLVRGELFKVAKDEFAKANRAGMKDILSARKSAEKSTSKAEAVTAPPSEPVPASIHGVDVMDLEDAVQLLWKAGIYAESGMGCTGPVVMISEANGQKAEEILREGKFIS